MRINDISFLKSRRKRLKVFARRFMFVSLAFCRSLCCPLRSVGGMARSLPQLLSRPPESLCFKET